tara:strand:- start:1066 stop:1380 length:315 start_codon:yes stop_codon:yes gene_type:complete
MWTFKTGDLVAKIHPAIKEPLQVGLVIGDNETSFLIKWTSFNKSFFMEKEEDIFGELNKSFLLDTVQVYRTNREANLLLLNSTYSDGNKEEKINSLREKTKKDT